MSDERIDPTGTGEVPESADDGAWGEGLGYPAWAERFMPALHSAFLAGNRRFAAPLLRMGLGGVMSSPLTGYLMLLRTIGRKSGEWREAPLGYVVHGDAVYCMAGFGRPTHWFQNVLADPHVEVILPGRAFTGVAEEVTDPDERRRALIPLVRSMGSVVVTTGLGNPWRQSPEAILEGCAAFPLVRIRATGIAAGPNDPGGLGWVVPVAGSLAVLVVWRGLRRAARPRRPAQASPGSVSGSGCGRRRRGRVVIR